jgi:futalosine hydrolase
MRKLLLVSATDFEIQTTLDWLGTQAKAESPNQQASKPLPVFQLPSTEVHVLITGVGLPLAMYYLGRHLALQRFDLVVNAGIAGALDESFALGSVWQVTSEQFADLGVEEADGRFTDLFQLQLIDPLAPPFQNGVMRNPFGAAYDFLPKTNGITVSKVHGHASSIAALKKRIQGGLESMEGAATFYASLMNQVPFLEIRAVSNYVEPRNRANWEIGLAIKNLNEVLAEMLKGLLESFDPSR